ncbi:MAG: helix-turn-helix domain-containing protein [Gemmatimonadetes bacterium]|nr:helix-turn-helix domain-containing protein [Gemmatimonadota bacterium]
MILAPIKDPSLLRAVRRASLPVEDVFVETEDILRALRGGFPRVSILESDSEEPMVRLIRGIGSKLPILEVAPVDLRGLRGSTTPVATRQIDVDPVRLRRLIEQVARPMSWVEGMLRDLGQVAGRPLPLELRALARRVLEFPSRYALTEEVAGAVGLTPGAMRARFRRLGLPSPFAYTVRLRALCACELLTRQEMTTTSVAYYMGYSSSGNFCRAFLMLTGLKPSVGGTIQGRLAVTTSFAADLLRAEQLEKWEELGPLFVRAA